MTNSPEINKKRALLKNGSGYGKTILWFRALIVLWPFKMRSKLWSVSKKRNCFSMKKGNEKNDVECVYFKRTRIVLSKKFSVERLHCGQNFSGWPLCFFTSSENFRVESSWSLPKERERRLRIRVLTNGLGEFESFAGEQQMFRKWFLDDLSGSSLGPVAVRTHWCPPLLKHKVD